MPSTLLIAYKGNGYSVPKGFIGKKVKLIPIGNKPYIHFNTELITIHEIELSARSLYRGLKTSFLDSNEGIDKIAEENLARLAKLGGQMTNNYNKLLNNLETLGVYKFIKYIDKYVEYINSSTKIVIDALYEISEYECSMRVERAMNACVKVANFPFIKTFNDFNFSIQPSINKEQIINYKL